MVVIIDVNGWIISYRNKSLIVKRSWGCSSGSFRFVSHQRLLETSTRAKAIEFWLLLHLWYGAAHNWGYSENLISWRCWSSFAIVCSCCLLLVIISPVYLWQEMAQAEGDKLHEFPLGRRLVVNPGHWEHRVATPMRFHEESAFHPHG